MNNSDKTRFTEILKDVFDVFDKEITSSKLRIYFDTLKKFTLEEVSAAFSDHVSMSKFVPRPADILEQINSTDGRPDENEAWAIAINSNDESETVVWTDEISTAFFASREILLAGDKQGAKMAFREIYSKLVNEARKSLKPIAWTASLGSDSAKRESTIKQALVNKLINGEHYAQFLASDIKDDGIAISGLLTGGNMTTDINMQEKLQLIRDAIKSTVTFSDKQRERSTNIKKAKNIKFEESRKCAVDYVDSKIESG